MSNDLYACDQCRYEPERGECPYCYYRTEEEDDQSLDDSSEGLESEEPYLSEIDESHPACIRGQEDVREPKQEEEDKDELDPNKLMPIESEILDHSDIESIETHMQHGKNKWAKMFKNNEQAEFFLMLPLTKAQRVSVIEQLLKQ